ncbi:hypothetical protein JCM10213_000758 [Rhodosporidiobolus nylandii]
MFTPLSSFLGGLLLSYSTSSLLVSQGRVLGCSGVAHGSVSSVAHLFSRRRPAQPLAQKQKKELGPAPSSTSGWKVAVLAGLLSGGWLLKLVRLALERALGVVLFDTPLSLAEAGLGRTVVAGLLVGVGTKMANGCTSGHMLLGIARLSTRSLAAVLTFFTTAFLTARLAPYPHLDTALAIPSAAPSGFSSPASLFLLALPVLFALPQLSYRLPSPSIVHAFSTGATFTVGLTLAGMTRPSKVLSFFYLPLPAAFPPAPAAWDPSLAMVALGGLLPNAAVWQYVKGWQRPLKSEKWEVPKGGRVDARLLAGAALFGVGWGLAGICPGPLFAVLGAGPSISGTAMSLFATAFAAGGAAAEKLV